MAKKDQAGRESGTRPEKAGPREVEKDREQPASTPLGQPPPGSTPATSSDSTGFGDWGAGKRPGGPRE